MGDWWTIIMDSSLLPSTLYGSSPDFFQITLSKSLYLIRRYNTKKKMTHFHIASIDTVLGHR
jgi:hypothetical protein